MLYPRRFIALAIIVFASLVTTGVVQGLWTNRWANSNQGAPDLDKLPWVLGTWEGAEVTDDHANQVFSSSSIYLRRRYVNRADGTVADLLITQGRPGPMVIKHLPTECYESAGFELVGQPKRYLSESEQKYPDEFWMATFKKTTDVVPVTVRVYWSWTGDGRWQTPERPRFTFAQYSVLYKMYVVQNLPNEDAPFEGAPVHDLIKEVTVSMRRSVFSPTAP